MFYYYFRAFNWISTIFGMRKPFIASSIITQQKAQSISIWCKFWSVIVIICLIASYIHAVHFKFGVDIKTNLKEVSNINSFLVSIFVILINMTSGQKQIIQLYLVINKTIMGLKLNNYSVKMIALKLYLWFVVQLLIFFVLTALEIFYDKPPYLVLVRIPMFLCIFHLIVHLCLVLGMLKIVNSTLVKMLKLGGVIDFDNFIKRNEFKNTFTYLLDPKIYFIEANTQHLDLKYVCKIYDDLCTSVHLLEKCHGIQMLLTIWLMFSSAVATVTSISSKKILHPWLEIIKGVQLLIWFFIGCGVDDQIRQEVEYTDLLIIKHLIDFRCDKARREILQTFKLVVSTSRLQFKACHLYRLNFATLLGTIVSVVTYSIICVQLL